VSLSLEAPNYCLCIQSNSAGFSFVNTGKPVHLKHARRHFERNLVKDVHHRSVPSRNWFNKLETRGSRSNACRLLSLGPTEGQSVQKYTPQIRTSQRRYIRQEIQAVNVDALGKVFQNLERRLQMCLDVKGDQFQHRLLAGPVLHRFRYAYINFQVINSII